MSQGSTGHMYLLMLITIHYSKDYVSGVYSLDRCLVKAYSQQTKEMNGSTGKLDTADMIQSFVYSATRGSYSHCYFCTSGSMYLMQSFCK